MIKQRSPKRKKVFVRSHSSVKSNAKKVTSDNGGNAGSCKKKRTRIEDLYDNDEAKCSVMELAEEILANVAPPGFVKCMLPSNVTHGFWLIFPKKFCDSHLPMSTTVILEDELGKEYKAKYFVDRHGLSGGWRGFSLAHGLVEGDCLVFYLIKTKPCTLKVHIVRVDEVNAALCLCLMNLDALAKRTYSDKNIRPSKKEKKVDPLLLDTPQTSNQENCPVTPYSSLGLVQDLSKRSSDGCGSEVLQAFQPWCKHKKGRSGRVAGRERFVSEGR